MRRVEAADIEGRVCLGIALRLRVFQHVGKASALGQHQGEDVVAGAVEDAVDAADGVALQALADRLDHGNAAGHSTFEIQRHAMLLGKRRERRPVMGEQRLVGGDHMLPGTEGGLDRVLGDALLAADQLDEGVDLGIAGELNRIGDEAKTGNVDIAVLVPIERGDGHDLDRPPDALAKVGAALGKEPQDPASDRAEPGEPEFQRLSHLRIRASSSPSTQVE